MPPIPKKPSALIFIADGSEEIEFVSVYDVLVRAGIHVQSVGVELKDGKGGVAKCSRGTKILPDLPRLNDILLSCATQLPDIIILPGGLPGAKTFSGSKDLLQFINKCRKQEKWIACICAATVVLVDAVDQADDEKEREWRCKVTSHPSVKDQIVKKGWEYSEERVVVDKNVVSSRGPGTALGFALMIVEILMGKEKREEVAKPMIVAETL